MSAVPGIKEDLTAEIAEQKEETKASAICFEGDG
jgi:hypothetical protein